VRERLSTYLEDHLAGARVAVGVLGRLRDQHRDERLGRFAVELLSEVEQDRDVLERLAHRVGDAPRRPLKQAAAWVIELASQLKLHREASLGLGPLLALETLGLGIQGKIALWRALERIAPSEARIAGLDLEELTRRAQDQHARVEEFRLDAAERGLAGS
jgi:hypothetical protein